MKSPFHDRRYYRLKNPVISFFCPLCRTERSLSYSSRLQLNHYVQITITSLLLMILSYSVMEWRIIIWPFIVWGATEGVNKILFRKQVPCPHCGFDATWYKRDIKVARRLVDEYWKT